MNCLSGQSPHPAINGQQRQAVAPAVWKTVLMIFFWLAISVCGLVAVIDMINRAAHPEPPRVLSTAEKAEAARIDRIQAIIDRLVDELPEQEVDDNSPAQDGYN